MDTTTLRNQLTVLRSDGELARRLSELDVKLGAWLSLVQAQHAALVKLARKVVPSAVPRDAGKLVRPADPRPVEGPAAACGPEDALLQTLDRETARAIRIKRRLCHGSRSVQELLDEYRAAQAQPQAEPSLPTARRGWWRRKHA
jgi:hypothetical protein